MTSQGCLGLVFVNVSFLTFESAFFYSMISASAKKTELSESPSRHLVQTSATGRHILDIAEHKAVAGRATYPADSAWVLLLGL